MTLAPYLSGISEIANDSKILRSTLLLAALLCGAPASRAQFTGPAFESTNPPNRILPTTTDPAVLAPPSSDIKIDSGDVLTVTLFGVKDYSPPARVALDGTVQLPLIGKLPVAGLGLHQAEDAIAARLVKDGMYRDPQVTIQFTDYSNKFATVTGEMHAIVPITGERRLFDVISAANQPNATGLPVTASRIVTVLRPGLDKPIVVDMGMDPTLSAQANIPIYAHDTIIISHVGMVYVVGAFKTQGAIPLEQSNPLSLMQSIAISGGAGYEGKLKDLRIIRTVGTERRNVPVDVGKVFRNEIPDPILQAGDIVFLPSSSVKAALKNNGINAVSSLLDVLIIALQYR